VTAELDFHAERDGTGHGVCLWFDSKLFQGISFSPAPWTIGTVYGQLFLPWLEPVAIQKGQQIHVGLHADLVGQEYVWQWKTRIPATANRDALVFQQSTSQGANYSPNLLRRKAVDYVPILSEAGQADLWMLGRIDGSASLQKIAQAAAEQFPHLFSSWHDGFRRVADLSSESTR
jgi:hypothetical protein